MKLITLTRGYQAQVSDEDYERINSMEWFACVGAQIRAARMTQRQMVYMSHEVLEIMPWNLNGKVIDHWDRNPLNNQKNNLRLVTQMVNMQNTARSENRKGYCYNFNSKSYCCYLDRPGRKRIYLGYAKTEAEAIARVAEARDANN